jgi:pachytene checkpoint protein 2
MKSSKYVVVIEVCVVADRSDWEEWSSLARSYVRVQASRRLAQGHRPPFLPGGLISLAEAPPLLTDAIRTLRVCDISFPLYCTWTSMEEVDFSMQLYQLCEETAYLRENEKGQESLTTGMPAWCAAETTLTLTGGDGDEDVPALAVTPLPHPSLEGQWESLYYGEGEATSLIFKRDIVSYADTAMRFTRAGVNPHLISWNRLVLFYGPPGTGKTSLCRALAQKLAIRLASDGYPRACLLDINAHSLFSRWFSESGKQVLRVFEQIHRIAADGGCFVCCVMDEVESLAAARASAMKGNEPSDSIRVVNALLTQMDRLQRHENVLVLSTSNLTDAIDEALLDRADKRVFVGPPGLHARQTILQAGVQELLERGLVELPAGEDDAGDARIRVDMELSSSAVRLRSTAPMEDCEVAVDFRLSADTPGREEHQSKDDAIESENPQKWNEEADAVVCATESPALPSPHSRPRGKEVASHVSPTTHVDDSRIDRGPTATLPGRQPPCRTRTQYTLTALLRHVAEVSEGLNGRTLKKLPFLAFGKCVCDGAGHADGAATTTSTVGLAAFLEALFDMARQAAAAVVPTETAK